MKIRRLTKGLAAIAAAGLLAAGILTGCAGTENGTKEKVLEFSADGIQSMELDLYDSSEDVTRTGWCFREQDMEGMLSYLAGLNGQRMDEFPYQEWPERFYGIRLYAGATTHYLLIAGDCAVTGDGSFYRIDGEKAEEVFTTVKLEDSWTREGLSFIPGRRFAAVRDGIYLPVFMQEAGAGREILPEAVMETEQEVYAPDTEWIEFTIQNLGQEEISYGSPVLLEVSVDGVWYSMYDMTNEAVEIGWTDEMRVQSPDSTVSDSFYMGFYSPLPEGTYRLVKQIYEGDTQGYAVCEFRIKRTE